MAGVNPLCDFLPAPFQIVGILESFHSRMEMDCSGLDDMAIVILAFSPSKDLAQTSSWGKDLAEYVQESPVLMGFDLHPEPRFFTGIEWFPHEEVEDVDSSASSDLSASTVSTVSTVSSGSSGSSGSNEDPLAESVE